MPAQCSRLPKRSSRTVFHKETKQRVWHCCLLYHIQTNTSAFLQRIQVGLCTGLVPRGKRRGERRSGGLRLGHGEGWQVTAWAGFLRSWGAGEGRGVGNQTREHLHCDRQQEDLGREMAALAKGNGKRSLWGELMLWRYSKTRLCLPGSEVLQTWGIIGEPWEELVFSDYSSSHC